MQGPYCQGAAAHGRPKRPARPPVGGKEKRHAVREAWGASQ